MKSVGASSDLIDNGGLEIEEDAVESIVTTGDGLVREGRTDNGLKCQRDLTSSYKSTLRNAPCMCSPCSNDDNYYYN